MESGKTDKAFRLRISSFKVILIMVTLMMAGAATIPLLSLQYSPSQRTTTINVSCNWYNTSARLVERELTSKIEGALAPISGIEDMSSESYYGGCYVSISFKKGINIDATRFEISSRIKQIYPSFPDGVGYPYISGSTSGGNQNAVLTYAVKADLPTGQIQRYAEENIRNELIKLPGVDKVEVTGGTDEQWVITFDSNICSVLGIRPGQISAAISQSEEKLPLGFAYRYSPDGTLESIFVSLNQNGSTLEDWDNIEITSGEGRIIRMGDIATMRKQPDMPRSYYRINGLNNINVAVYAQPLVNTLTLVKAVDGRVEQLRETLPRGFSISKEADASIYINRELSKIYWRTGISILILLLFVFLVSRSMRYMMLILITMVANILIAFIFYNLFDLEIHIYALAGITVSLCLIIDTSIIMIDHYGRFGDHKVFLAILAALLTTIGALIVVLLLPDAANIIDFAVVIMINLTVSLVISALFIPALLEKLPIKKKLARRSSQSRGMRRKVRFTGIYSGFISWSRRHRWVYVVIAILGFGLPVHMLPSKLDNKKNATESADTRKTLWTDIYSGTVGSSFYQDKAKIYVEYALGGSLRLFAKNFSGANFRSEPERTRLYIRASLPQGCTVHQLNEVMVDMENFLSDFDEIESFTTNISSHDSGSIEVTLKPEAERKGFIYQLQAAATSKAIDLGGASWNVYGVGQGFNNRLSTDYKNNWISLQGYNYDQLYRIAQEVLDTISLNARVKEPEILGSRSWGTANRTEFFLDFDFDKFSLYDVSPVDYFSVLSNKLYSNRLPDIFHEGRLEGMSLISSEYDSFDAWHMTNDVMSIGDRNVKLSQMGSIEQRQTGNNISKQGQQYRLYIGFNFIGSYELAGRFTQRQIDRLKNELPVGYRVLPANNYGWWGDDSGKPYGILMLIIVIIYFLCAILFESLRQPLVIVLMIPISYIGVFLTFYIFRLNFDDGGFASFVLLSALVVNAGIYIINEYNILRRRTYSPGKEAGSITYLRAYNRKIVPIILTVISTVLGLIPFIVIGREPFWFTFAAGVMGGMIFSLVSVFIYLPIFLPLKLNSKEFGNIQEQ